ncbi:nidogen-2 [Sorex araneus]|uniref:nidogen-2 n=1 Tax=Sorex araneus TaxID=42254 RepID=UPI002433923D|nr:nidogen-2 [Sorex araneus]
MRGDSAARLPAVRWLLWALPPLLLRLSSKVAAAPVVELFPHGESLGDQLLPEGDDESAEVTLAHPLHFYEAQFSKLYVGTNGIISTQDFPRETQYVDDVFPTDFPAIAPFLADLDTSGGRGKILYREDMTPAVLDLAAKFVRSSFPHNGLHFTPIHTFLVTWKQVGAYQEDKLGTTPSKALNTFQAVLVSNETDSYAFFLYPINGLQFFGTHPKESYSAQLMLTARVGFCRGELDEKTDGPYLSLTSTKQTLQTLSQHSNLEVGGVWAFRIGSTSPMYNIEPAAYGGEFSKPYPAALRENPSSQEASLESEKNGDHLTYPEKGDQVEHPLTDPEVSSFTQDRTQTSFHSEDHLTPNEASPFRASSKETCEQNHMQCSQHAFCTNYPTGFCCHCHSKYYGNGIHCLPEGAPNRVIGKVSGHLRVGHDSMDFSDLDLHSYMVGNDGRAYTSISSFPVPAARALLPLIPIGGLFGWLFALEKPGWENGFRLTGATFIQDMEITFNPGGERVQITQRAETFDSENNMYVHTHIHGQLPSIQLPSAVDIEPYKELYHYSDSAVTSTSTRNYTLRRGAVRENRSYHVRQNITYQTCKHAPRHGALHLTQQLTVDRAFVSYLEGENMLTYAVSNQMGPVEGDYDGTTVNPCFDERHTCDTNARCQPASGVLYTCECIPGFHGNGWTCLDINECSSDLHNCGPNSICINLVGSYRCDCVSGYQLADDLHTCTLIEQVTNPCEDGSHTCAPADQARCIYHGGRSFSCTCLPGYVGDGHRCTDVDECSENTCHPSANCFNTPGSFSCYCQPGYNGDGFHCHEDSSSKLKPCEQQYLDALAQAADPQSRINIPHCDDQGNYMPLQCHSSTGFCWCVEPDGKRVPDTLTPPGSIPPECGPPPEAIQRPPTMCQRWRAQLLEVYKGQPKDDQYLPQCDDEGEFIPVQCQGNSDFCWCVNKEGKEVSRPYVSPQGTLKCDLMPAPDVHQPTTEPEIKPPFLLYAHGTQIGYMPLRGTHFQKDKAKPLLSLQGSITVGIDYDCREKMVYWTDVSARTINRVKLEPGAEREVVIDSGVISPEGLALDVYHRRMYYTDSVLDKIETARLDGSDRQILFHKNLVNPRAITLDPIQRNLYWTDWNREAPKIETSTLDGRDRRILVYQHLALPNALTFDHVNRQLCWADAGTTTLECAQPDGSGRRIINSNLNYPFSIVSYEDHFYLTDWRRDGIIAINRTSGQFSEEYLPDQRTHLYEITLVQPFCPAGK